MSEISVFPNTTNPYFHPFSADGESGCLYLASMTWHFVVFEVWLSYFRKVEPCNTKQEAVFGKGSLESILFPNQPSKLSNYPPAEDGRRKKQQSKPNRKSELVLIKQIAAWN